MEELTGWKADMIVRSIQQASQDSSRQGGACHTIAVRYILVADLLAFTDPGVIAGTVVTEIIEQGGALSIADRRRDIRGGQRVSLHLHGVAAGGDSLEDAAVRWLSTAQASLNEGAGA